MRPRDWHSSDRGGSSPLCTGGLVGQVRGSLLLVFGVANRVARIQLGVATATPGHPPALPLFTPPCQPKA
ncbi:hypothetical protein NQZ68_030520 [Dissostichus eleginoides]|nr:hypothetical protein NQZ68_030520 [Dissostichus eleginoides]